MEIGYAVLFLTWMNTINFIQLKVMEEKMDNVRIEYINEDVNKYNIKVIGE
jgi:hypothetical protein